MLHISDIWNNTLKAEAQMLAPDTPPTPSHCFADDMDNNTCNWPGLFVFNKVPLEDLDGHRAPVFELLSHTRSIDTQTPSHTTLTDCYTDQLPIMLEVAEICMRSNSQGSEDNSACSSQGGESEERSQSVSPSFIPG